MNAQTMQALASPELPLTDRPQTWGEEIANSISHGIGFLLAVAALPVLVSACVARGGQAINVVAVCVFAATMMLLYGSSTLYHALPAGRAKRIVLKLDHGAIYIFIVSFRELSSSAVLTGPNNTVMAVLILELQESGRYPQVAALSVLMVVAMGALVVVLRRLGGSDIGS